MSKPIWQWEKPEMNPILRFERRPTHLNAIKAMCAHCMGCTATHIEPGFRQLISGCSSTSCPLHRYRPFQKNKPLDPPSEAA